MHECFLVHYSLMMVAVCYQNVRKQVSQLASAYELSRCSRGLYLVDFAFLNSLLLAIVPYIFIDSQFSQVNFC